MSTITPVSSVGTTQYKNNVEKKFQEVLGDTSVKPDVVELNQTNNNKKSMQDKIVAVGGIAGFATGIAGIIKASKIIVPKVRSKMGIEKLIYVISGKRYKSFAKIINESIKESMKDLAPALLFACAGVGIGVGALTHLIQSKKENVERQNLV